MEAAREDVLKEVVELLEQHRRGSRGSMHQEPYKGDIFKVFARAYNGGLLVDEERRHLRGDALYQAIIERRPVADDDTKKQQLLEQLDTMWREWTYAWERCDRQE